MAEELSYVLLTPNSLRKSRTGGIISRLLARTGLDLVAGRLFAPSAKLVSAYADLITEDGEGKILQDYVRQKLCPDSDGCLQRVLLLVLRGEDACRKTREVIGNIVTHGTHGGTIRDTYGDYIIENERVIYFEPAALTAPDVASTYAHLELWSTYSDSDGGILENSVRFSNGSNIETTLVLIKPDNFRFPNMRAGGVLDTFSRSGLDIVGFKVHRMSVAEAEEFYRPVLEVLLDKMRESSGKRARSAIEEELGVPLDNIIESQLAELLGPITGRAHWESIVQFMCGTRPGQCPPKQHDLPGSEKCIAVVYRGINAVAKIREILGPTDPSKAPYGSIRREFGQTVMINAAHASDSVDNARREMEIIHIHENNLKPLLEARAKRV